MGGNRSTRWKPTQTWGKRSGLTQTERGQYLLPQCQTWPLSHRAALGRSMRGLIAQFPRIPEKHAKETRHRTSLHTSLILISTGNTAAWSLPQPREDGSEGSSSSSSSSSIRWCLLKIKRKSQPYFTTIQTQVEVTGTYHMWLSLMTLCYCVSHWGLWRLVQTRLENKQTQDVMTVTGVSFLLLSSHLKAATRNFPFLLIPVAPVEQIDVITSDGRIVGDAVQSSCWVLMLPSSSRGAAGGSHSCHSCRPCQSGH